MNKQSVKQLFTNNPFNTVNTILYHLGRRLKKGQKQKKSSNSPLRSFKGGYTFLNWQSVLPVSYWIPVGFPEILNSHEVFCVIVKVCPMSIHLLPTAEHNNSNLNKYKSNYFLIQQQHTVLIRKFLFSGKVAEPLTSIPSQYSASEPYWSLHWCETSYRTPGGLSGYG